MPKCDHDLDRIENDEVTADEHDRDCLGIDPHDEQLTDGHMISPIPGRASFSVIAGLRAELDAARDDRDAAQTSAAKAREALTAARARIAELESAAADVYAQLDIYKKRETAPRHLAGLLGLPDPRR